MATGVSSSPCVSLTDLLQEVGIFENQLDNSVSDDHLLQISKFLTSRERLAPFLGLDESDREVIEADGKGEEEKRLKMLEKWRCKYAFRSSYRKLVDALLSLEMTSLAEKVCRLVARPEVATDSGGATCSSLKRKSSSALVVGSVQALKKKWARLTRTVRQKLDGKNFKVEDIADYVGDQIAASVSIPHSSISEIFGTLRSNGLWNYLSCALLWSIVDEYLPEDGELSSHVNKYKSELEYFKKNTKVVHFIPIINAELSPDVSVFDPPPMISRKEHYKTYTFESDVDPNNVTLMDVERSWETQIDELSLPDLRKGLLQFIQGGSVLVTYLIPAEIVPEAVARVQASTKFFEQQGILSVVIDGKRVYPQLTVFPVTSPTPAAHQDTCTSLHIHEDAPDTPEQARFQPEAERGSKRRSVMDAYIRVLSDLIGQNWKHLARELELTKTEIDVIEYNNVRDLKEQIFQFFHTWKMQEGNAASVEKLREGLRRAGLREVEREAESKFREQSDLREKQLKRLGSNSNSPSLGVMSISTASSSTDSTVTTDSPYYRTTRQPSTGSASGDGPQQSAAQLQSSDPTPSTDSSPHSQEPQLALPLQGTPHSFEVGDMIMVERPDAAPWYGVIKYLGDPLNTGKTIAGLEIDSFNRLPGGGKGELNGVKYFDCADGHGLFLPVERLKRDNRFATSPSPGDSNRVLSDEDLTSALQTQSPPAPETPPTTQPPVRSLSHSEPPVSQSGADATPLDRSHSLGSTPLKSPIMGMSELLRSVNEVFGNEDNSSEDEQPPASASSEASASETTSFSGILVFTVPGDRVGLVIGREGKNLREVESQTNTIITISKDDRHNVSTNGYGKIVGSEENCEKALLLILQNLQRRVRMHISTTKTIPIPSALCGRVIGAGGTTCRAIETLSGAEIKIDKSGGLEGLLGWRECKITGLEEQIDEAEKMIREAMAGADIMKRATLAALIMILTKKFGFQF